MSDLTGQSSSSIRQQLQYAASVDCKCTVDVKTIEKLIDESFAAKLNAYCPYSRFPVGAAILCQDGSIFTGTQYIVYEV